MKWITNKASCIRFWHGDHVAHSRHIKYCIADNIGIVFFFENVQQQHKLINNEVTNDFMSLSFHQNTHIIYIS